MWSTTGCNSSKVQKLFLKTFFFKNNTEQMYLDYDDIVLNSKMTVTIEIVRTVITLIIFLY